MRNADNGVAHVPARDPRAQGGDVTGVLVAADRAGPAPALDHEVEVAAAHAAVADLDEHLAGPGLGNGPGLERDGVRAPVHGHGHGVGGWHEPQRPEP